MKTIQLTQGQVALVSDEWYDVLNVHKWRALWDEDTQSYYAVRMSKTKDGKLVTIYMHAVVAGTPKGMYTDHIDHNGLHNYPDNLRVATPSQNQMNKGIGKNNTSGFKGVSQHRRKWQAQIQIDGRLEYLGTFPSPALAAVAYDEAATRLFGEYAVLNFPTESP